MIEIETWKGCDDVFCKEIRKPGVVTIENYRQVRDNGSPKAIAELDETMKKNRECERHQIINNVI